MRELPRQLSVEELTELFSGRTELVERLAAMEDPLGPAAEDVVRSLSDEERFAALEAHPRIGERSPEQHGEESEVLAELERLNRDYEERFGFRFVVFVAGRPRAEILPVLRERIERTREEELQEGVQALVDIARDRWAKS